MTIALITDSTCDIPQELVEKYGIYITPQHVIWGKEDLLDGVDISAEAFYKRLPNDPNHPKTSQPIAKDFLATIKQAQADGATEAVIMTISQKMSGTFASAQGARAEADIPIYPYDSRSASMGLGWQVIAAARAREAGADAEGMVAAAAEVRQKSTIRFSVDTLEFLHKGGRIGGAARLVGTALNLKPELYIDHETGQIEAGERTRTRRRALDKIYSNFAEEVGTGGPLHVTIVYSGSDQEARALASRLEDDFEIAELYSTHIAPVIGVHVGPGAIGLAGYTGEDA